jgi:low affinity Fe/Cu permease
MARPEDGGSTGPGRFERFASVISAKAGAPAASMTAFGIIVVWAVLGPVFGFSDTWQLVINTATTILTFLMVFVIQNSLNRGNKALHLKVDELIRASAEAHDAIIGAQELSEAEIDRLEGEERQTGRPT